MSESKRYHSLDAVRACALLTGIVLHSTLSFWPGFRELNWPISDDSTSLTLSGTFFVIHMFRMSLYYVIAGFFAHILLEKAGVRGLIRNRLRRIALPFIAAFVVVSPLLIPPYLWGQKKLGFTGWPHMKPAIPDPHMPPWGHFWFLYLLLVLYAIWLVVHVAVHAADRRGQLPRLADRVLAALVESRLAVVALAAPSAVVLYYTPWWVMWQGLPQPVMGFVPNVPAVLAFGTAFGFGWFLHRSDALLAVLRADWWRNLLAAAACSAVALLLVGPTPRLAEHALPMGERTVYSAVYLLGGWFWVFGLIGAGQKFMSEPNPRWRYLADSSFYIYIVHLPIVYTLQAWVMLWPLHWMVKYPLVVGFAFAISFVTYHYGVRSTFVGQFLSGRRYRRGEPTHGSSLPADPLEVGARP
jgi:peptidoglycan/LPS O-acetylase OafA/YrhL